MFGTRSDVRDNFVRALILAGNYNVTEGSFTSHSLKFPTKFQTHLNFDYSAIDFLQENQLLSPDLKYLRSKTQSDGHDNFVGALILAGS